MKILVVDDSRVMRQIVIRTLRQSGYAGHDVVEAENGLQAVEMVATEKPDLVLSDWNMPEMNGLALIQGLRARAAFAALPILVLTTESDDASKQAARTAGATGWLNKPLDAPTLVQITTTLLGVPRTHS